MLHDFYIPNLHLAVRYDRVAGYFRSSFLAAASIGFSALAGRRDKMRLIVGADLEPEDVKAILAGDRDRLAARLNGELDRPASWPEGMQNGVTLLAWMVAHGYLEVRVALWVNRETGEPLPFDAVNLPAIWEALSGSQYLRNLGCAASTEPGPYLTLSGIDGVPEGAVLTVSRELYEEGLAGGGVRVHFASYGDPFFDAVLEQFGRFGLPGCVRRMAVKVPGMNDVEMVGYAAACRGAGGVREVRLILAWSDLNGLCLAEAESLTEAEVAPLREKLEQLTREEFAPCLAAERIERENIRAARAQEVFNFLVIRDLLETRARPAGEGALFWPVLREVASLIEEREQILAGGLPAEVLREVAGELLFDCRVPGAGGKAHLLVPRYMARAAVDAAGRLADSMKVRKSELRVDTMLARLQREIKTRRQQVS